MPQHIYWCFGILDISTYVNNRNACNVHIKIIHIHIYKHIYKKHTYIYTHDHIIINTHMLINIYNFPKYVHTYKKHIYNFSIYVHTYKKHIYNFFTYVGNTYINFSDISKTHTKNIYITFLHMYVWVHIYKKHIY